MNKKRDIDGYSRSKYHIYFCLNYELRTMILKTPFLMDKVGIVHITDAQIKVGRRSKNV